MRNHPRSTRKSELEVLLGKKPSWLIRYGITIASGIMLLITSVILWYIFR